MGEPVQDQDSKEALVWSVYALHEPSGEVRYVGISKNPVDRVKRHYRECMYGSTHRKAWLRGLLTSGREPLYSILEVTGDWAEAETRWIAYFKASGAKLVNGNDGGRSVTQTAKPRQSSPMPMYRRFMRESGQVALRMEKCGNADKAQTVRLAQRKARAWKANALKAGKLLEFDSWIGSRMKWAE